MGGGCEIEHAALSEEPLGPGYAALTGHVRHIANKVIDPLHQVAICLGGPAAELLRYEPEAPYLLSQADRGFNSLSAAWREDIHGEGNDYFGAVLRLRALCCLGGHEAVPVLRSVWVSVVQYMNRPIIRFRLQRFATLLAARRELSSAVPEDRAAMMAALGCGIRLPTFHQARKHMQPRRPRLLTVPRS